MKINVEKANLRLTENKDVWFYVAKFSHESNSITYSVSPRKLHDIEFSEVDSKIPLRVHDGEKWHQCSERGNCFSQIQYHVFAAFFTNYDSSVTAFNFGIEESMRIVGTKAQKQKATMDSKVLDMSRLLIK